MTETIEIEKLVRYNATDGDILVLTPSKDLGRAQMDHLNEQMVRMCAAIKDQYGKDVSSVVLPVGFKLELISVGAKRDHRAMPTTGLHFNEYLLREFYTECEHIRRACWPPGDYISADGADGGTLWYYASNGDEFIRDYKLGFHELGATDWEIV